MRIVSQKHIKLYTPYLYSITGIWPCVAFSLEWIVAGFPITTECDGTSKLTKVLGAINTSSPIVTLPTTVEFALIHTRLPIVGTPFRFPLISLPIVTPCVINISLPNFVSPLITIRPQCPIINPFPKLVFPSKSIPVFLARDRSFIF